MLASLATIMKEKTALVTSMVYFALTIKGPPNDIYCIIEEPYKHYFTEKVSYSRFIHICPIYRCVSENLSTSYMPGLPFFCFLWIFF